jgi:hypothetical protein
MIIFRSSGAANRRGLDAQLIFSLFNAFVNEWIYVHISPASYTRGSEDQYADREPQLAQMRYPQLDKTWRKQS